MTNTPPGNLATNRFVYVAALAIVIAIGIVSRSFHVGNLVVDKYLGDALYAVMIYLFFRVAKPNTRLAIRLIATTVIVIAIESFQLTGIPLSMRQSDNSIAKVASIALGTKFAFADLVAYSLGLLGIYWGDLRIQQKR